MNDPKLAKNIRCLVLDVDGVLTDGSIMIDDHGVETKRFSAKDGQGIAAWIKLGFEVAVITSEVRAPTGEGAVAHRCRELGIQHLIQGAPDKAAALAEVSKATGVPFEQMAYIGDDWPDMPALRRVGLPVAVADAAEEVRAAAAMVTERKGGFGAVREVIVALLRAKGMHDEALRPHLDEPGTK